MGRVRRPGVAALALVVVVSCGDGGGDDGQFAPSEISLRERGELKELLDERLVFTDAAGLEWVAPRGTLTDGASVPRIALPVTNGRWDVSFLKAAVVHDAYCQSDNETRAPEQYRSRPWRQVHRMFYQASLAGGTPPLLAKVMFAAVWLGGPKWDEAREDVEPAPREALTRGFSGAKHWIEENDPSLADIEADLAKRAPLARELFDIEQDIERALEREDTNRAETLLQRQRMLLDRELQRAPEDVMLQIFDGQLYNNRAVLNRRLGRSAGAADDLRRSEATFQAVIREEPDNPSALSGLARSAAIAGELDRAERLVDDALRRSPSSPAALEERQRIERLRIEQN